MTRQEKSLWLLWTGLLLSSVALLAVLATGLPSRALAPLEATMSQTTGDRPGGPETDAATLDAAGVLTVTHAYLPSLLRDFEPANFSVTKSVTPTSVIALPGQVVTYTVTFTNEGTVPGELSSIQDQLPAGFTFQRMAAESDVKKDPSGTTGTIVWSGPFPVAGRGRLRLVYRVEPSQTPGPYTNLANATARVGSPPPQPASAALTVQPAVLLQDDFNDGIGGWTEFLNMPGKLEPGQWWWSPTEGVGGSGALAHTCCLGTGKLAGDALMMFLGPGAEEWTDYRVEAKLNLTGGYDEQGNWGLEYGDPIGLWVRGQYEPSDINGQWLTGYYVVIRGKSSQVRNEKYIRLSQLQTDEDHLPETKPQNLYRIENPMVLAERELPGGYDRNRWYKLTVEVRGPRIKIWLDDTLALEYEDDKAPFLHGTVGFKTHESWNAYFDDLVVTPLP